MRCPVEGVAAQAPLLGGHALALARHAEQRRRRGVGEPELRLHVARAFEARAGRSLPAEPAIEVLRRERHHLAAHGGVARTAVLRAEDGIPPRRHRLEPHGGVAPRDHVLLHAELGHEEAVDDVARGHHQPHRAAGGHVELGDRARARWIGERPHPLLGRDVHVHRPLGRDAEPHEEVQAGDPERQEEHPEPDQSGDLEEDVGLDAGVGVGPVGGEVRAPVADDEVAADQRHQHRAGHRGEDDGVVELIEVVGDRRHLPGQEEEPAEELVHGAPLRACRRSARSRTATSPATVSRMITPPSRMNPTMKGPYARVAGS